MSLGQIRFPNLKLAHLLSLLLFCLYGVCVLVFVRVENGRPEMNEPFM